MRYPSKRSVLTLSVISAISLSLRAETQLPAITVQANGIPYTDTDATYASEVHDRSRIAASGATTLVDYLAQNTTLNVISSYGNSLTPALDMRGYGLSNGYENIAISVDGRRLNEINMSPAWLGTIPLETIERIEITKGSGSVAFGDNATAGSIQIYTRTPEGVTAQAATGNYGYSSVGMSGGKRSDMFEVSASAHTESSNGASQKDTTGHRASTDNRTEQAKISFKPAAGIKLTLDGSESYVDTRYPNPLTQSQFNQNPSQNGGAIYVSQIYDAGQWRLGGEFALGDGWQANLSRNQESKRSNFVDYNYNWINNSTFDYSTDEIVLKRRGANLDITAGWRYFDGARKASDSLTTKRDQGLFAQATYRIGLFSWSAGLRKDIVSYSYNPTTGTRLANSQDLSAWDVGVNYRIDEKSSVFANLNSAFLAPDIDTFFVTDFMTGITSFNGFIVPMRSKTFNVGYSRDENTNRLRGTLFYSKLNDEIYYNPIMGFGTNTNLSRTHKYGLELQDQWQLNDGLSLSAMYTYTRALIDQAGHGNSALDGKELPGVPRHGVTLGMSYRFAPNYSFNLNHVWRSQSYNLEDFTNSASQRQASYQKTNLSVRYQQKDWEGFVGVENLLKHKNGLWVRDNDIYPVDFARTVKVGLKKTFL